MGDYYSSKLSGQRLRLCYEIAPPRVQRYLQAEIAFVLERVSPSFLVLELGCGYGRVMERLAGKACRVVGIDTSRDSLRMAQEYIGLRSSCQLIQMNAAALGFRDRCFDVVACIQNGISAFNIDRRNLIQEAVRVTRPGGTVLFSSYSQRFWPHRLEWFRTQAQHGLIGPIDEQATGGGVIVCKDGFRATTVSPDEFTSLLSEYPLPPKIIEVDRSSLFCEISVV
ncbi:MAG: class I SAM-dependent methyltransferase [Gemmatimonadota bacterium]|nr:MAG: class I SAM-dependent methyltransferase [Gemmatimonadota bacterium]